MLLKFVKCLSVRILIRVILLLSFKFILFNKRFSFIKCNEFFMKKFLKIIFVLYKF